MSRFFVLTITALVLFAAAHQVQASLEQPPQVSSSNDNDHASSRTIVINYSPFANCSRSQPGSLLTSEKCYVYRNAIGGSFSRKFSCIDRPKRQDRVPNMCLKVAYWPAEFKTCPQAEHKPPRLYNLPCSVCIGATAGYKIQVSNCHDPREMKFRSRCDENCSYCAREDSMTLGQCFIQDSLVFVYADTYACDSLIVQQNFNGPECAPRAKRGMDFNIVDSPDACITNGAGYGTSFHCKRNFYGKAAPGSRDARSLNSLPNAEDQMLKFDLPFMRK